MKLTLLDEQRVELTEITWRFGQVPGRVNVDRATRPEALFRYYFDDGKRSVTAVTDGATWTALLGTRWQMGARFWFLHGLVRLDPPPGTRRTKRKQEPEHSALAIPELQAQHSVAAGDSLAGLIYDPRGIPD